MDKIIIKNISVYAYHGAMEQEKTLGQKFFIDVTLYKSLKKAGELDSLKDTVHYGMAHDTIVEIATKNRYDLIEALGENICKELFKNYEIEKIELEIRKPNAPINGTFDYVGIWLERHKDEY